MSKASKLSVLLPARDAEGTVERAVRSVLEQSRQADEVVVVDDRSTDRTREILESLAAHDPRIRIVEGSGTGLVDALNAGLARCTGPLVARMDADDESLPRRFERQLELLDAAPSVAAVGCQVEIFGDAPATPGTLHYEAWLNSLTSPEAVARDALVESPLVHPAAVVRRDALEACGGWRSEGWPEDYALWLRMLRAGFGLSNVPERLFRWRDHPSRLTRTHPDYAPDAHVRLKVDHLAQTLLKDRRCIVWGAGKSGRALLRALRERGIEVTSFVEVDKKKIGRPLHGVPVIAMEDVRPFAGVPMVVAVGAKGARQLIRDELAKTGWREVAQYVVTG